MQIVEPHTVYVDDSGTDSYSRIVTAALCVSTVRKWKQFEAAWVAAEERYGFKHFHMTEFAGCRRGAWCRECNSGKKTEASHPWREWSNTKRHEVLAELLRITCKHTLQGFGEAFTKEELNSYVIKNEELHAVAKDKFGKEPYTFAATTCAGELARWRFVHKHFPPLKIIFDGDHKLELARAFLPEYQVKPRINVEGLENWFDCDVGFESRKTTRQLLSSDILAWVATKIRVAYLFPDTYRRLGGWGKEVSMVAFRFIDSGKLHIGYNADASLREWLEKEMKFWEQWKDIEDKDRSGEIRGNNESAVGRTPQRDLGQVGVGEAPEKTNEAEA